LFRSFMLLISEREKTDWEQVSLSSLTAVMAQSAL
jgi:hypothetical protein